MILFEGYRKHTYNINFCQLARDEVSDVKLSTFCAAIIHSFFSDI